MNNNPKRNRYTKKFNKLLNKFNDIKGAAW